jgi:hypothetical protein
MEMSNRTHSTRKILSASGSKNIVGCDQNKWQIDADAKAIFMAIIAYTPRQRSQNALSLNSNPVKVDMYDEEVILVE